MKFPSKDVPIIGRKKYDETHVLEVGEMKLFPPVDPRNGLMNPEWPIKFAMLRGMSNAGRIVLAEFGFMMPAFLAEDHPDVGKKYDMVTVEPDAEGSINITLVMPPAPPATKH